MAWGGILGAAHIDQSAYIDATIAAGVPAMLRRREVPIHPPLLRGRYDNQVPESLFRPGLDGCLRARPGSRRVLRGRHLLRHGLAVLPVMRRPK
jgi:hypothetical protein